MAATPDPLIARTLETVLAAGERALPGRIRAGYLFGSHAEGSAVAVSDVDVFLVLHGSLASGEVERLREIGLTCLANRDIVVDIAVIGDRELLSERILRQTERLAFPVTYPDPHGEFFGYDSVVLPPARVWRRTSRQWFRPCVGSPRQQLGYAAG